ncbi:hypothetical protein C8R45DRAFT_929992 [Mycena sanguinolenta]|nr:hypothetical protein C8R45DRAFT_929992 [Mycena sanguinolenta]
MYNLLLMSTTILINSISAKSGGFGASPKLPQEEKMNGKRPFGTVPKKSLYLKSFNPSAYFCEIGSIEPVMVPQDLCAELPKEVGKLKAKNAVRSVVEYNQSRVRSVVRKEGSVSGGKLQELGSVSGLKSGFVVENGVRHLGLGGVASEKATARNMVAEERQDVHPDCDELSGFGSREMREGNMSARCDEPARFRPASGPDGQSHFHCGKLEIVCARSVKPVQVEPESATDGGPRNSEVEIIKTPTYVSGLDALNFE